MRSASSWANRTYSTTPSNDRITLAVVLISVVSVGSESSNDVIREVSRL